MAFDLTQFNKDIKKLSGEVAHGGEIRKNSFGSLKMDRASGGGFPVGITEIYGHEAVGKTVIALSGARGIIEKGGTVVFIDMEHALDPRYLDTIGVEYDNPKFIWKQPVSAEDAFELLLAAVKSGANMVILDSVAALVPQAELEGDSGEMKMGLVARLMGQLCRKLSVIARQKDCSVVFINQIRMKLGVMFGNPETTTGGNALKFYALQRIEVLSKKDFKYAGSKKVVGHTFRAKFIKNKVGMPKKEATEVLYLYESGYDLPSEVLEEGKEIGIITLKGNSPYYGEVCLGRGKDSAINFLRDNPELTEQIHQEILKK